MYRFVLSVFIGLLLSGCLGIVNKEHPKDYAKEIILDDDKITNKGIRYSKPQQWSRDNNNAIEETIILD